MTRAKSEAEMYDAIQQYGKKTFTEKEQIDILRFILEDIDSLIKVNHSAAVLLYECKRRLKNETKLSKAIPIVNAMIIELEAGDNGTVVDYLKQMGLYRILYRNPRLLGKELPQDDLLHKLLRGGFIGVGVSALCILLYAAAVLLGAPFWLTAIATGLFVGSSTYLSGILYGVVNDIFGAYANLPYFLLGHQPQQKSVLRTNNKVAQGIAWGVAATAGLVAVAAIIFTVAATITAFFVPIATFVLPLMMLAMPLVAVGAELYARKKAGEYAKRKLSFVEFLSGYQSRGLDYMSPTKEERAAWLANSDRNGFGYTKVPLIGLVGLVGLVVLSAVSMFLPAVLIASPLVAFILPVAFAATACVGLIGAGVYMYVNRNKQTDDRYRLEFDRTSIEPDLYFDEDREYANSLLSHYGQQEALVTTDSSKSSEQGSAPLFATPSDARAEDSNEETPFYGY